MEFVIFGDDEPEGLANDEDDLLSYLEMPDEEARAQETPKRPSLAKRPSDNSHVDLSPTLWRDYLNDDSDSGSDGESEQSEQEWEDWMTDLPRQHRIQADTEERHLRHLTPDIEEDDEDIPWIQDEALSDDGTGVPASDDGMAESDHALAADKSATREPFPPSRKITSYSSADSLIRKSIRPSRSRPRIFGASKTGVDFPSERARSPLSSQVRASSELSTSPESGTSPPTRSHLPVRMPIPIRMRITSVRGTQVEGGTSPPETASPRLTNLLRKGGSTNESTSASQHPSAPQGKNKATSAGAAPPSLILTIPEPNTSASSPSSLESIKFATPDSD
ncbi:hypothetical protein EVJ58_g4502 [Rhodofomes roseus]|nr:hypothetical protein EVJ58_g4502 [Rhodofomes roseus]